MTDQPTQAPASPLQDRMAAMPPPTTSKEARDRLVNLLRRDLIGPHPDLDPDLAREVLTGSAPSTWYLTGYLAPHKDAPQIDLPQETADDEAGEAGLEDLRGTEDVGQDASASGREDDAPAEPPRRTFLPSSLGLTVLVPDGVTTITARVTWGDYRPQPPLAEALFLPERANELEPGELAQAGRASDREWHRVPHDETLTLTLDRPEFDVVIPGSRTPGRTVADALELHVRVRPPLDQPQPDGTTRRLRAVTVFVVNRRFRVARKFADVANAHQVRLALDCAGGFAPVQDVSRYGSGDADDRLADLHYREERAYAAGHNTSAGWADGGGSVWTDPLPAAEVRGMRADVDCAGVERGMEALAVAADAADGDVLHDLLVS